MSLDPQVQRASSRPLRALLLAVFSLLLLAATALAAPGDLDTSFSGDGKVTTNFSGGVDFANAVAIQPDGKIVVVGSEDIGSGFALARFNANGTLDDTFDGATMGNGKVTTESTGDGLLAEAFAVAIQPSDQKIVVAGYGYNSDLADGSEDFVVARYNTDGTLDTTGFGTGDGTVFTRFAATPDDTTFDNDRAEAVAVQGDGDIVAAGYGDPAFGGTVRDFAVARYDSNGVLDSNFGGDGKVTRNITTGGSADFGHDLALLSANKVLVVGSTQLSLGRGFALAQFNSDGSPDLGFDGNGIRTRNFEGTTDDLLSVALQGDGKIVTGGQIGDNFSVARFNANGSDDNSFDGNGYNTTTFSGAFDQVWNDLRIQGNGKIVTAGVTNVGVGGNFAIGRFFSNGAVDRNFAPCFGAQRTDFGDFDAAEGLAIDSSGRLVAGGFAGSNFAVARYLSGEAGADCVNPNTTIKGPRRTRKRRPVYRLISTEAGSTFRCRINGRATGKPFKPCTTPFKMPRLKLGPTRFEARAIDKAGNADPTPAFIKIKRIRRRR